MSTEAASARELARRLITRAAGQGGAPVGAALAAHAACERTYRALTRSVGPTGSRTLLTRALAQSQAVHPLLKEFHSRRQSESAIGEVTTVVQAHGASAVAAGLEAVLETLLGMLGRLIGDDMAARLVDQSVPDETPDDEDVK